MRALLYFLEPVVEGVPVDVQFVRGALAVEEVHSVDDDRVLELVVVRIQVEFGETIAA